MLSFTFNNLTGASPRSSSPSAPLPPSRSGAVGSIADQVGSGALAPNPQLEARRAQALRKMFPKLSGWFGNRRDALYIGQINDYLAQARNVTDLEQRIRLIEQQRHFS